jgi:predicted DNA-binding helix-hairpin-helix protein
MDEIIRLKTLSEQMCLEPAEECGKSGACFPNKLGKGPDSILVHPVALPDGSHFRLLKTLLTSACERDCFYCPFRAGRDFRRATFQPEEFAHLFAMLVQKGIAEGVFLSSGINGGGIRTQDKLIDTAEIMRRKLGFIGYIHLKIMPGAERAQVERAMQLADRVSVNLEAPNTERLIKLAPHKQFTEELLRPLQWIEEIRHSQPANKGWQGRWPSSATQFVTGASGESDLELLTITDFLYRQVGLRRAYYSAFNPIPDTPLANQPPTPAIRGQRLYQASFLLRDYGFSFEDLPFDAEGKLPVGIDPKTAWARTNLTECPIEINQAGFQTLIKVPGIGIRGARVILNARRQARIKDISTLKRLCRSADRAVPYLLFDGRKASLQPALFTDPIP